MKTKINNMKRLFGWILIFVALTLINYGIIQIFGAKVFLIYLGIIVCIGLLAKGLMLIDDGEDYG
jgi:hypothetical protein